jgi:hypothetical protein
MLNGPDLIASITKHKKFHGIFEVYHRTSFQGYRTAKNGESQKVEVDIFDAGPNVNSILRYHCVATTEDGKRATGNAAESVDIALAIVHWGDLDR